MVGLHDWKRVRLEKLLLLSNKSCDDCFEMNLGKSRSRRLIRNKNLFVVCRLMLVNFVLIFLNRERERERKKISENGVTKF